MLRTFNNLGKFGRFAALAAITVGAALAQVEAPLTWQQKEEFLRTAQIVKASPVKKGITQTERVTLSDGKMTHDASVQRIDEFKQTFDLPGSLPEVNFKDTYKFNIAGWKFAQMLGLEDMVPPTVERNYKGKTAFTWWVDDVMMDEGDRLKKNLTSPEIETWRTDTNTMYVFDQLVGNMDRNQGNMLIDKAWRLWMIDHTRAFRPAKALRNSRLLFRVDRNMLAKMKELDKDTMKKELGRYLGNPEIDGILARRDIIVKHFEEKGDTGLMDRPARPVGAVSPKWAAN